MTSTKINNVSSTIIFNCYEGFYLASKNNQDKVKLHEEINQKYNKNNLLEIAKKISYCIHTEILNISSHSFEPYGESASLLIQADLSLYNSATLHLKESHITFHTYIEDILDDFIVVRLEFHISSCSEANVFDSISILFNSKYSLSPDIATIDYLRRGAKYGHDKNDIIHDTHDISDTNFKGKYDIYKTSPSINTKNVVAIIKKNLLIDKLKNINNFLSDAHILDYRDFLIKSYTENI